MKRIVLTILIFAFPVILSAQKPIAAHPGNPHYFIWKGEYLLNWIRPVDGEVMMSDEIQVTNGSIRVDKPEYETDLALRIILKK